MEPAALAARLRETIFSQENLERQIPLVHERIRMLGEFPESVSYFHHPAPKVPLDEVVAAGKGRAPKDIADALATTVERLDALRQYDKDTVEAALRAFADESGVPANELFMYLRLGVTGRKATPPLFETIVTIGRASVAQRLRAVAEGLKVWKPSGASKN